MNLTPFFADEAIPHDELDTIRLYLQQQRAWGRDDFRTMVETKTHGFANTRPPHRPPRHPTNQK